MAYFVDFLTQAVSTVFGGIALAGLLFLGRDRLRWLQYPKLSGAWTMTTTTTRSEWGKYAGMRLEHIGLMAQEGAVLVGSGEKVWEHTVERSHEFVAEKRPTWSMRGYVTKRIFAPDEVVIHLFEKGHVRETSSVQVLVVGRSGELEGRWWSSAADSCGTVTWRRAGSPTGHVADAESGLASVAV